MAHTVYSVSVESKCYEWLCKKADRDEVSIMKVITQIMRTPRFLDYVQSERTWIDAVEACIEDIMEKQRSGR